jgi:limonene-1,2-epoxide hydrolase
VVRVGSTAEANDAMVRAFLAAWEQRDTERILECFTEDAVYHSVPLSPIVGKEAIGAFVRRFEGVPPGRLVVHHQVATDQVVMNERTDTITRNGVLVELPICGVFEIRDGRISAWREYFDLGPVRAAYATE